MIRGKQPKGVVLLEALVALTLVSITAVATLTLARADAESATRLLERSREVHAASDFLEAVTLWTRSELDARLGTRQQGPYLLRIVRPTHTLYTLELIDAKHSRRLCATAIYRPEESRGSR